ncbi:mechanosensitive ion channel domain-containing protein [Elstera sp.]|jgi:small conductance mechanosensitive channel|uniref:mechanosensitive ion channel domain-containing protein n=1 Tax=Elstera sp. TaxID=1916664 RepID=UPI0037BFF9B4
MRRILTVLALLWLGFGTALAADPPKETPPDLPALIETLKNDQAREALIKQLTLLANPQKKPAPDAIDETLSGIFGRGVTHLSDGLAKLGGAVSEAAGTLAALPDDVIADSAQWRDPARQQRWAILAGKVAILLLCALVSEWLLARALRRPRQALADRPSESRVERWLLLAGRFVLDLLPVLTFAAAAQITLSLIAPDRLTRLVLVLLINANLIVRVVLLLGRLILAPEHPRFRLVTLTDETAAYCYVWLRRMVALAAYGLLGLDALRLLALPDSLADLIGRLIGLTLAGMAIILILQNTEAVRQWLRRESNGSRLSKQMGDGLNALRHRLADVWHVLAIVYIVAVYSVWTLEIPGGFLFLLRATGLTVLLSLASRWIKQGLRHLVTLGFTISPDLATRFPGLEARANRYLPVLQSMLSIGLNLLIVVLLLQIWGLDSLGWLIEGSGRKLLSSLTIVLVVLVIAVVVWEILSSWIERLLQETEHDGQRRTPSARMRTLLPLLRNALLVVLVIMVSLIVLSEIGINIAPLLAGAGVVGLAVGFGSQTLVKDLITGLFILIEDSIAVGDSIEVAGKSGTVEAITIRTIRLRDLRGAVHTIPFSAVTTIQNSTKTFSFAVVDVTVDYKTDLDLAAVTLSEADTKLRADTPNYAEAVLEPLEVFGLDKVENGALVLRVRVKTLPGKQWSVERMLKRGIKEAFDRNGITLPGPAQLVLQTPPPPLPPAPAPTPAQAAD